MDDSLRQAQAHDARGVALFNAGRAADAADAFAKAVALCPNDATYLLRLAAALQMLNRPADALAYLDEALRLQPNRAAVHNNRGGALMSLGRVDEAAAALRRAVELKGNDVDAMCNLSQALIAEGKLSEARTVCRRVLAISPDFSRARMNLANLAMREGRAGDAVEQARAVLRREPNHLRAHTVMLYCLHFQCGLSANQIHDEHVAWAGRFVKAPQAGPLNFANDRNPHRKLRIGYLSGDFREHPVGRAVLPLLLHHDRERFEVFCYSDEERADDLTRRLRSLAHQWHEIGFVSNDATAQLIRTHQIDVLIDLSAHMWGDRFMTLAQKPAPVQASFIGYPATTGMPTVDYRITDAFLDPPGETESFNTEKLIRLPKSFYCWLPDGSEPDVAPAPPSERNGFVTFGSFNNVAKVSVEAIELWARILHAIPDSRLNMVVNELGVEEHFTGEFARRGIGGDRLRLVRPCPRREYLAFYHDIDIALDPFPYNGGVTTCDALWMGAPVITLRGETSVGRAGVSLLANIGLPELIGRDAEDYLRIATALARDQKRLAVYRRTLREQMRKSPITDAAGFTRDVEAAYRTMWRAVTMKEAGSNDGNKHG